jgi:hypothetical protein
MKSNFLLLVIIALLSSCGGTATSDSGNKNQIKDFIAEINNADSFRTVTDSQEIKQIEENITQMDTSKTESISEEDADSLLKAVKRRQRMEQH